MADQVPVVPADVQQLQDALAVPPAQAGAAQDAQNIDGGDPPAAVMKLRSLQLNLLINLMLMW